MCLTPVRHGCLVAISAISRKMISLNCKKNIIAKPLTSRWNKTQYDLTNAMRCQINDYAEVSYIEGQMIGGAVWSIRVMNGLVNGTLEAEGDGWEVDITTNGKGSRGVWTFETP